jgi:protein O-GlcNAc transferase
VSHVLGQCLLAEITGRLPVVQWGGNSLFSDHPSSNAFETFFEPVSGCNIKEIATGCPSCYPPK